MKEKIVAVSSKLLKHELISGSMYLFIGSMASNVFAFVLNLILVRRFSYTEYAEITALISLITLASIPTLAFTPTIVQFAGRYFAKNQERAASAFFFQSNKIIGVVALFVFLIFFIFSSPLAHFLHIENIFEIVFSGIIVASMYMSITNTAFLQSLLKFQFLAFTIGFGGLLKLIVSIGLLFIGFGIFGVLWGYFLCFLIPLLITFIPLRFLLLAKVKKLPTGHSQEILTYGLPATVAVFALSSFTSSDILLVKHFFPVSQAALYSGLSLVGRIIFYFSSPISSVMFPLVTKRFSGGESVHKLLYMSFLMVLVPSLGLSIIYFLFPRLIISIVLGAKYFAIAPLLGWFGIYLALFSLLSVVINFLLSIKKTSVSFFVVGGALLQILGISLLHSSITLVVAISLIISLVLFILLLLYYQGTYANKKEAF